MLIIWWLGIQLFIFHELFILLYCLWLDFIWIFLHLLPTTSGLAREKISIRWDLLSDAMIDMWFALQRMKLRKTVTSSLSIWMLCMSATFKTERCCLSYVLPFLLLSQIPCTLLFPDLTRIPSNESAFRSIK